MVVVSRPVEIRLCLRLFTHRYLRMAAEEGYVPAMYDLGLACKNRRERECWLEEAARNGWRPAIEELGDRGR